MDRHPAPLVVARVALTRSLRRARILAAGPGFALSTTSAIATPHGAIGGAQIFLGLLLVCWVGFPLLLLGALSWQLTRSHVAFLRRSLPAKPAPDIDVMT
jgi:hypothetical protein